MYLKAFIFGSEGVGKTELRKHLTLPDYVNKAGKTYPRSIAPDFNTLEIPNSAGIDKVRMNVWDTAGNPRFKSTLNIFYSHSHFGLFCVDLSKPLNQQIINELENDITEFKKINPAAHLILVGTKSDSALPDALNKAQQQFADYPFIAAVPTSAREQNGAQELFELLALHTPQIAENLRQEQAQLANKLLKDEEERRTILYARNRCIVNSNLYLALDKLHHEASTTLSSSQIKKLGQETNTLLDHFSNPDIQDKIPGIQAFVTNCTEEIQRKNYALNNTLLTIAYTLTAAVIASLIGFGIGFALGAWSGPGAFLTGLAAGSASAVAVVSSASVCGAGALAYSAYHFFKAAPILSSIKEIAEKGTQTAPKFFDENSHFPR